MSQLREKKQSAEAACRLAHYVQISDVMKPYVVTESGGSEEIGKSCRFQLGKNYRATVKMTANARLVRSPSESGFEKFPWLLPRAPNPGFGINRWPGSRFRSSEGGN